jgi:hypothetical protein
MKRGLLEKLALFTFISFGMILFPYVSRSQNLANFPSRTFQKQRYVSVGAGFFHPAETSIREIYGDNILRFRGGFLADVSENVRIGAGVGYFNKEGDPYVYLNEEAAELEQQGLLDVEASSELKTLNLEAFGQYVFRGDGFNAYAGVGYSSSNVTETLEMSATIEGIRQSESSEFEESSGGMLFMLGGEIPFGQDQSSFFYGEYSNRSAKIEDVFGGKVDLGGSVFEAGVRFAF